MLSNLYWVLIIRFFYLEKFWANNISVRSHRKVKLLKNLIAFLKFILLFLTDVFTKRDLPKFLAMISTTLA